MDAVLQSQKRKNFGITTMHERVEAIGGTLDIVTLLGSGTSVTVSVPVELPEGEKGVDPQGLGL
jgi:signal transduction histidine kinase